MALLKYFNYKTSSKAVSLPNENGPLAQHIPSSSIQETNKEVSAVMVARDNKPRSEKKHVFESFS